MQYTFHPRGRECSSFRSRSRDSVFLNTLVRSPLFVSSVSLRLDFALCSYWMVLVRFHSFIDLPFLLLARLVGPAVTCYTFFLRLLASDLPFLLLFVVEWNACSSSLYRLVFFLGRCAQGNLIEFFIRKILVASSFISFRDAPHFFLLMSKREQSRAMHNDFFFCLCICIVTRNLVVPDEWSLKGNFKFPLTSTRVALFANISHERTAYPRVLQENCSLVGWRGMHFPRRNSLASLASFFAKRKMYILL